MRCKILLTLMLSTATVLFACDGNCVKCHPTLIKNGHLDKNHAILSTCMNCHKVDTDDLAKMGAICGQDCWQCHDVKKVMKIPNKAHLSLNKCIDCHTKLDKKNNIFDGFNKVKSLENTSNIFNIDRNTTDANK